MTHLQRVLVMRLGVILNVLLLKKHWDNGVFAGALLVRRWMTLHANAQTGQTIVSPEVLRPMPSPDSIPLVVKGE